MTLSRGSTTMDRRLGRTERVLYEVDRIYPCNFTTVAHVRGPLTEEMLRGALTAVTARHPHLTRRLVVGADGAPWFRGGGAPLILRWERSPEWIPVANREANERLPIATGPLIRCAVVEHAPDEHTLMLTFQHSAGDASSGAFLMRDLLQAASGTALEPLADPGPVEGLLPPSARGWRSLRDQAWFFAREAGRMLRLGPVRTIRDQPSVLAFERQARVVSHVLDAATLERLSERARREGTTVHGALSAALILAMVHDSGEGRPMRVGFGAPVNLRRELTPSVGEALGVYVSMTTWGGRVSPDRDFWELAREVREALVSDQARGFPFAALEVVARVSDWLGAGKVSPQVLAERMERRVPVTGRLTNLGRVDIETRFGPLQLERLHFLTSPSALSAWVSTATTVNEQLVWNFTWAEPAIAEAHARALADDSVRRLMQAIEGPKSAVPPPKLELLKAG